MSLVSKRTVVTTRHEYVVPSPVAVAEIAKAVAMAQADMPEVRRHWDDSCTVEARDDEIVVWWEEDTTRAALGLDPDPSGAAALAEDPQYGALLDATAAMSSGPVMIGSDEGPVPFELPDVPLDDECLTCGEVDGVEGECPGSKRPCGHHCNHSWTQDLCHWCGEEIGEEG